MDAEIEVYSRQIRSLLDRICASVEGLSESQLSWLPTIDGANSAYVIDAHTLGCVHAWVLGIACGRATKRDRPAEFRAAGGYAVPPQRQVEVRERNRIIVSEHDGRMIVDDELYREVVKKMKI